MNYAISVYPYYHGVFKTDEYFEVYKYKDGSPRYTTIALFGNKQDAEEYMEWIQTKVEVDYRTEEPEHLEEFARLLNKIAAIMKERKNE